MIASVGNGAKRAYDWSSTAPKRILVYVEANTYAAIYRQLNAAQRRAVDTIYGPVLVLAGPGTGKTQLLSARVAQILKQTDAAAQNILCLTFTESGAQNMRERLSRFIGQDAYSVQIETYHSFGSTIIRQFPEYFTEARLERPIDELGKRQILSEIVDALSYQNPLKQTRHHLGDLISTVSELKRGLLSPAELRRISSENMRAIEQVSPQIAAILEPYPKLLPRKLDKLQPIFEGLTDSLASYAPGYTLERYASLLDVARAALQTAVNEAQEQGKTTPFTQWKNAWLVKDGNNRYMLSGTLESLRVASLADVLEHYQGKLEESGLYDFDDMILKTIAALNTNDELRFTLQERYQFVLLDEFQDTNAAQFRLVQLLTDNPVHEGRPNVLAVGDDDQAIYAFQGADYSNMLDFYHAYRDVEVISLEENYRSGVKIVETAGAISGQIATRLAHSIPGVTKSLHSTDHTRSESHIERRSYKSAVAERVATAKQIAKLVQGGVSPSSIAVLAPKHKYLEPLVPYLHNEKLPVQYEKRENILDAAVIRELLAMSRLVLSLAEHDQKSADALWPQILSYDFWGFSTADIWRLSWDAAESRTPWAELVLDTPFCRHVGLLILAVAAKSSDEPVETILDYLIGTASIETRDLDLPSVRSPLRDFYLQQQGDEVLYHTATVLSVLRARLREFRADEAAMLTLADLQVFVRQYEAAEQPLLNTSPYSDAASAVQLMTVFKAKGLEFDHVFLIACDDSAWGGRAIGVGNKLTLPANLMQIRHAGSTDDERLRLLYVAITRAREALYLTSHEQTFSGNRLEPVRYFNEFADASGQMNAMILPEGDQHVFTDDAEPPSHESLTLDWTHRHQTMSPPLKELLRSQLNRYQLSPTHLTHFLDLKYGGPESFLLHTLLRFPSATTADLVFGNAIHETLQWLQNEVNLTRRLPSPRTAIQRAQQYIGREKIPEAQLPALFERVSRVFEAILSAGALSFGPGNVAEKSFRSENVFVHGAHMGGKIDLLEIDQKSKTITVVDYKTGRPGNDAAKLHRYSLQLYCYKIIVESSRTYRGFSVPQGKLIYVEPDSEGKVQTETITFDATETQRVEQLIAGMWSCVMRLDMPDISGYGESRKDSAAFEASIVAVAADSSR